MTSNVRDTRETQVRTIRVALYLRQSLDAALRQQVDGQRPEIDPNETAIRRAVRRQMGACEEWVKARSTPSVRYEIVAIYEDNDVSASKSVRKRKNFLRMLADAETGAFDLILSYHLDRLTRTIRDLLPLLDLATRKAHPVGTTTVSGDLDLTTDMGRMVAGILAVVAQAEVDRKSARQMLGNDQRADQGTPSQGGHRAFGFEPDCVTVRQSEAVWVQKTFTGLLAGASMTALARDLNEAGLTTVLGNPFNPTAIRHMIRNPRYAGIRQHRGVEHGNAAWTAIVDEPTYRAAYAVLADPSRRTNKGGSERKHLLTSVALCGVCNDGTTVCGGSRGVGMPLYQCGGDHPKHLQRTLGIVDDYVEQVVLDRLLRPDAADLLIDRDAPDLVALNAERLQLVARQEQAAVDFADGAITGAQLRTITGRLTARIEEIDTRMSHRDRERVLGDLVRADDPATEWSQMTLERRQAVLRALGTWTINKGTPGGTAIARRRNAHVVWTPAAGISA